MKKSSIARAKDLNRTMTSETAAIQKLYGFHELRNQLPLVEGGGSSRETD
jgi:hypothetical protein